MALRNRLGTVPNARCYRRRKSRNYTNVMLFVINIIIVLRISYYVGTMHAPSISMHSLLDS